MCIPSIHKMLPGGKEIFKAPQSIGGEECLRVCSYLIFQFGLCFWSLGTRVSRERASIQRGRVGTFCSGARRNPRFSMKISTMRAERIPATCVDENIPTTKSTPRPLPGTPRGLRMAFHAKVQKYLRFASSTFLNCRSGEGSTCSKSFE